LVKLLKKISDEGKTVVLVTHDVEFAAEVAARVVILHDGEVVADGERKKVLANSLYYAPQLDRLFQGMEGPRGGTPEAATSVAGAAWHQLRSRRYGTKNER